MNLRKYWKKHATHGNRKRQNELIGPSLPPPIPLQGN